MFFPLEREAAEHDCYHPALKEQNQEVYFLDKTDTDSTTMHSSSKSLLSLKLSVTSIDAFDRDNNEELQQKVKDLTADVERYRTLLLHLLPAQLLFSNIQSDGESPTDSHLLPILDMGGQEEKMFFGSSQQTDCQIHIEDLTPQVAENQNEVIVEHPKELLPENKAELGKGQIPDMPLLDEGYHLQSQLKGTSPLR